MNAKLFQIRLLKREKKGVLDRDWRRKPDSRTCERKLFRNMIRACAFWKFWKPCMCMGQSARTAQWEQNITSQCADPDRDWEGICNACERT